MKRKIAWLSLICLMVGALLLASCGPAAVEEEEEVVTPEGEEEVVTEEEVVVTEEKEMVLDSLGRMVEKPKYGGVMNYYGGDPMSFDECYTVPWGVTITRLTHNELFLGDWVKGPAGTDDVGWCVNGFFSTDFLRGDLAESWESPDEETLIFHLRKGVYWQDKPPVNGREFVADDVVFTFNRIYAECPQCYVNNQTKPEHRPTSITAPDKYTVVIKCPAGYVGNTLNWLGEMLLIMPPESVAAPGGSQLWENSCGTGPFMLEDYVRGSSATLIRNPNYHEKDPLHPENTLPYLDGIKWLIIPDASTRLSALRTGKIDRAGLSWEEAAEMMETDPQLEYSKYLVSYTNNIFMRMDKPEKPWADIRVRHALAMAIDNQEIVDELYGGNGVILHYPALSHKEYQCMYTPLDELPESVRMQYEYHPDKARQLLAEAGYPDGFTVNMLTYSVYVDRLCVIKEYWADIGVEMELDVKEAGAFTGQAYQHRHEDMILIYMDNSSVVAQPSLRPGATMNMSIVDDPYCNEHLLAELDKNTMNWDKICEIAKKEFPYVLEQCWSIEFPTAYSYIAWWPWLKSYQGEISVGFWNNPTYIRYLWLDLELKEEMGF